MDSCQNPNDDLFITDKDLQDKFIQYKAGKIHDKCFYDYLASNHFTDQDLKALALGLITGLYAISEIYRAQIEALKEEKH